MSWARFDDLYDDNRKVKRAWRAHPRAVGLHAMAVTYCSRHETDGIVDFEWIEEKLPVQRERAAVLAALVNTGLFEVCTEAEDGVEGYLVHDYLVYNPSSEDLEAKRLRDSERKRARNPGGFQTDSARSPNGIHAPRVRAPDPAPVGDARAPTAAALPVPSLPGPSRRTDMSSSSEIDSLRTGQDHGHEVGKVTDR